MQLSADSKKTLNRTTTNERIFNKFNHLISNAEKKKFLVNFSSQQRAERTRERERARWLEACLDGPKCAGVLRGIGSMSPEPQPPRAPAQDASFSFFLSLSLFRLFPSSIFYFLLFSSSVARRHESNERRFEIRFELTLSVT